MSQNNNSQNYKNHRMISKPYHMALIPYTFATMVLATIYFVQNINDQLFLGGIILLIACGLFSATFWSRVFAIKAQDRAIRAEESLRYFILTGKRLPTELTLRQIIALRFAEDEEFTNLVAKAVKEKTKPDDLKKEIKVWRADHNRV